MRPSFWVRCAVGLVCLFSGALNSDDLTRPSFLLLFDSAITSNGNGASLSSHLAASYLVYPIESELGRYRGYGRLNYVGLSVSPLDAISSDGGLSVNDMQISAENGTVTLYIYPAPPIPNEWILAPPAPPTQLFQWFGVYGYFHKDEIGVGGYEVTNWDYSVENVYARKTYHRNADVDGVFHTELTTIELIPVFDPPRIDKINVISAGTYPDDPETGKKVTLSADLFFVFPFEVQSCTWTGNNFTGEGTGDPDNNCEWFYTPEKGAGPERATYGDKDVTLTVVFNFGAMESAVELSRSEEYKVFFAKKGDDDSNSKPNWFDYWGDDGAVPGLDDSNVDYDASQTFFANAQSGNVFLGPNAADSDGSLNVPAVDPICPGGNFPGAEGVDLTAITLSHEQKHVENSNLGGTDTDGDGVPDDAEAGTSPNNPDSCNLAGVIHPDYATFGDDEFIARLAELGVMGVGESDWAVPGRQATVTAEAYGPVVSPFASGLGNMNLPHHANFLQGIAIPQTFGSTLTGSYASQGSDTDSDGLFNALLLDVEVDVTEPGNYSVVAWLADDEGTNAVWARTDGALEAGAHIVQLAFDGVLLNKLGVTQPFQMSLAEVYEVVGKHQVLRDFAENVHDTTYVSTDFDPPAALLAGANPELPVDDDLDGLFDSLDFAIDLVINDPGVYQVSALLKGSSMSLQATQTIEVAEAVNIERQLTAPQNIANEQVVLSFDGASIFYHREDGPYDLVQLRVSDVSDNTELDFQATGGTTASYLHSAFQQTGVVIDESSYTDMGGEPDLEGRFSTLEVAFSIGSSVPGPYIVQARLEDGLGKTVARAWTWVGLGGVDGFSEIALVQLSFNGMDISSSMVDGPYQLADVTVLSDSGLVMDQNPTPYLTDTYLASDFSATPPPLEELIFEDGFE